MKIAYILAAALALCVAACEPASTDAPEPGVTLRDNTSADQPAPTKDEPVNQPKGPGATFEMHINGMMCDGCKATVTKLIMGVEGVESAEVDLKSGRAMVKGKPGAKLDADKLKAAVDNDYTVDSCVRLTN